MREVVVCMLNPPSSARTPAMEQQEFSAALRALANLHFANGRRRCARARKVKGLGKMRMKKEPIDLSELGTCEFADDA